MYAVIVRDRVTGQKVGKEKWFSTFEEAEVGEAYGIAVAAWQEGQVVQLLRGEVYQAKWYGPGRGFVDTRGSWSRWQLVDSQLLVDCGRGEAGKSCFPVTPENRPLIEAFMVSPLDESPLLILIDRLEDEGHDLTKIRGWICR